MDHQQSPCPVCHRPIYHTPGWYLLMCPTCRSIFPSPTPPYPPLDLLTQTLGQQPCHNCQYTISHPLTLPTSIICPQCGYWNNILPYNLRNCASCGLCGAYGQGGVYGQGGSAFFCVACGGMEGLGVVMRGGGARVHVVMEEWQGQRWRIGPRRWRGRWRNDFGRGFDGRAFDARSGDAGRAFGGGQASMIMQGSDVPPVVMRGLPQPPPQQHHHGGSNSGAASVHGYTAHQQQLQLLHQRQQLPHHLRHPQQYPQQQQYPQHQHLQLPHLHLPQHHHHHHHHQQQQQQQRYHQQQQYYHQLPPSQPPSTLLQNPSPSVPQSIPAALQSAMAQLSIHQSPSPPSSSTGNTLHPPTSTTPPSSTVPPPTSSSQTYQTQLHQPQQPQRPFDENTKRSTSSTKGNEHGTSDTKETTEASPGNTIKEDAVRGDHHQQQQQQQPAHSLGNGGSGHDDDNEKEDDTNPGGAQSFGGKGVQGDGSGSGGGGGGGNSQGGFDDGRQRGY